MIDLVLAPSPAAAAAARHHVRSLPVDEETVEVISLLVTELVTNALRHARQNEATTIDVHVETSDRTVRVDVSNGGRGFTWEPEQADPSEDGGMGLLLVDRLADRWGVEDDGRTHVWLELDRSGSRTLTP